MHLIVLHLELVQPPYRGRDPAEAAAKAAELQEKIRKERVAREKQEAKDHEKARIESTKLMQEANAELEATRRGERCE